jgi:hypothetical protein
VSETLAQAIQLEARLFGPDQVFIAFGAKGLHQRIAQADGVRDFLMLGVGGSLN